MWTWFQATLWRQGRNTVLGVRGSECCSLFCHQLAVWPWKSHLTFQRLAGSPAPQLRLCPTCCYHIYPWHFLPTPFLCSTQGTASQPSGCSARIASVAYVPKKCSRTVSAVWFVEQEIGGQSLCPLIGDQLNQWPDTPKREQHTPDATSSWWYTKLFKTE